jgi:succinylglutamic semialdehyde dehydrogenase
MNPNRVYRGSYIQGHFVKIDDPNGALQSDNPGNLELPSVECPFSFEHVHEAVAAAKVSYHSWRRLSIGERTAAVGRYRDLLKQREVALAVQITFETGKPLWEAKEELAETGRLIEYFMKEAALLPAPIAIEEATPSTKKSELEPETIGVVRSLPRGVVAVISPAISPILDSHAHLIPALLYGNTVVLKSSRHAPLVGQAIAELSHDAGLPAGVLNVIAGNAEVAQRLVADTEVDAVFFTGSYETGLNLKKQLLGDYWKLLVLEMVGKNGMLVWDDAHYAKALHEALYAAYMTTGQRRNSTNRILVHEKICDRFVADFHKLAKKCTVGYGLVEGDSAPFLGPLLSEAAMENYVRYQGIAVREGCEEIMRGKNLERTERGYYVSPSIHLVQRPDPKSVYQKSEIFGPNVAIYRVHDLEEAIEILNLPQHGLVASVYSRNKETYLRAAEEVRVGTLHWNRPTIAPAYRLPAGGVKKSGNHRPMGSFAVNQCTYPLGSLESTGSFHASSLPLPMPRGEL